MDAGFPLHIVYVNPEIPQNTGSTARLCAATGIALHLVGPLGFRVDDKSVRRAGLDYWPHVTVFRHDSIDSLIEQAGGARFHYFSKTAARPYSEARFARGDYLVFGAETTGLPAALLEANSDTSWLIPIRPCVRSLNLATSTGIVVFEALKQLDFPHVKDISEDEWNNPGHSDKGGRFL